MAEYALASWMTATCPTCGSTNTTAFMLSPPLELATGEIYDIRVKCRNCGGNVLAKRTSKLVPTSLVF